MTFSPVRRVAGSLLGDVGTRGMQTPIFRPLASGDAATAADQGTPNGQLGNGALFTPAVIPPQTKQ